ncbi:MAG: DUF4249 family protein [Bacteroidota bacterium]
MKQSLTYQCLQLGLIGGLFLLMGCVSELDFEFEQTGIPIVHGILSNSVGERVIFVQQTGQVDSIAKPVSASGRIFQDGQSLGNLTQIRKGELELPRNLRFEEGKEYFVEVRTDDGRVFQTQPQLILPQASARDLRWKRRSRFDGTNLEGIPIEIPFVDILAVLEVDQNEEEKYYRWQAEDVWLFREVPKTILDTSIVIDTNWIIGIGRVLDTTVIIEEDPIKECFPRRDVSHYPSTLTRTGNLEAGLVEVPVMSREIDQSFLFQHYFNVYLKRIGFHAYDFYDKSERLMSIAGTLYDETPAPVSGNVFDLMDSTELVIGYVEMALTDTIRLGISIEELHYFLHDDCRPKDGGDLFCESYIPPCDGRDPFCDRELIPCVCWDCDSIYGIGADIRPEWWE